MLAVHIGVSVSVTRGAAGIGLVITAGALFGSVYHVPAPTIWAARAAIAWVVVSVVAS